MGGAGPEDGVSLADLFTLYGHILDELENRAVVRTRNQPLGDYAEWLTWQALGGKQSTNKSEKAYGVTADLGADLLSGTGPDAGGHDGARIRAKSRSVSPEANLSWGSSDAPWRTACEELSMVIEGFGADDP